MHGPHAEKLKSSHEMINFSTNRLVPISQMTARFGETQHDKTDINVPWKLGSGILYSRINEDKFIKAQKNF